MASLPSLSDLEGSVPYSAFPAWASDTARFGWFEAVVGASEAVATWPSTETKSERSGDGVLGMSISGYEDLLEIDGKEVGGGDFMQSLMVVSSGGVSRASGTREEIPKDLKDGSWRGCRPFSNGGNECRLVGWIATAARSFWTGAAKSQMWNLFPPDALQRGTSESE